MTVELTEAGSFLERGHAVLPAIVDVRIGAHRVPALRLTSTLAWLWEPPGVGDLRIGDEMVERVWGATEQAALIRTPPYEGRLPELQLDASDRSVVVVTSRGELGFTTSTRSSAPGELVLRDGPWPRGALVFDLSWKFAAFSRLVEGNACVDTATLLRPLEESSFWDEIAAAHRLVRSSVAPSRPRSAKPRDLARAVRWDPRGDEPPMPVRDRTRALRGASLEDLRAARGTTPAGGPEQRAIDMILFAPHPLQLEEIPLDELRAFATAAPWFARIVDGLAGPEELERLITRRRQLSALDASIGSHYAPRVAEEQHLETWLSDRHRAPLLIRGPGGIGKSALIARVVRSACPPDRFVWLDFDRPDLTYQEASLEEAVNRQLLWQPQTGTLILVLDSFETAVHAAGYERINRTLDQLAKEHGREDMAVIVGSRAPAPLLQIGGQHAEELELVGLELGTAQQWLVEERVAAAVCQDVVRVTNGVPLNLWLAKELLADRPEAEARALLDELPRHLITGYLYRRVLSRLKDPSLGALAPWAMVPRRLRRELLARIAPLIGATPEIGERLFTALKGEVTLLTGGEDLTVRADLRNTILPLLTSEDATRVAAIDDEAAEFWGARADDDPADAAEAIYHSLRIGDLTQAMELWRPGVEPYLRGYAAEEVRPAGSEWLQYRLATSDLTERLEDLLGRGRLEDARRELGGRGRDAYRVSFGARARRVLGFAPAPELVDIESEQDLQHFESLVLSQTRPALRVLGNQLAETSNQWAWLLGPETPPWLRRSVAATGRLRLTGTARRIVGTAILVGPGLFLTTASAVDDFVVGRGRELILVREKRPEVDLMAEGRGTSAVVRIDRAVLVHPYWDIALIATSDPVNAEAVSLAASAPANETVVAIGHPGDPGPQLGHLLRDVYRDIVDVKRVMPGMLRPPRAAPMSGIELEVPWDDTANLSPDPGAAIFDPRTGALLGVRFHSVYTEGSAFIPTWELVRDPAIVEAHVRVSGTPAPGAPPWLNSWRRDLPVRQVLLDAYVAWREGDVARAGALIESLRQAENLTVADRIDRALLAAAVELSGHGARPGAMLEAVVDGEPTLGDDDRVAIVATRLRLVVEGDTELALLEEVSGDQRLLVEVMSRAPFRVVAPQPHWRWRGDHPSSAAASTGPIPPAVQDRVTRLQRLEDECNRLAPWIARHGLSSSALLTTGGDDLGARMAALVAYPREAARDNNGIAQLQLAVRPHPQKGWEPSGSLVKRLLGGPGAPPDVGSDRWLDDRSMDGTLLRLLSEAIGEDTDVSWVAGLFHLLTPMPLDQLLVRRMSSAGTTDVTTTDGALNLDAAPYPWHLAAAREFYRRLIDTFPDPREVRGLVNGAGSSVAPKITWDGGIELVWRIALNQLAAEGTLRALVTTILQLAVLPPAMDDYLNALLVGRTTPTDASSLGPDSDSAAVTPTQAEAVLFSDDLSVPIAQVHALVAAIRSVMRVSSTVCRVKVTMLDGRVGVATGTLLRGGQILTVARALRPENATVSRVVAEFHHEFDADGSSQMIEAVDCDLHSTFGDTSDDWAVIRASKVPPNVEGFDLRTNVAAARVGEQVFMLHHAYGQPKRLAFARTCVTNVDDRHVLYLADAGPGSTGALVFNGDGRAIALHSFGGRPHEFLGREPITKNVGVRIDVVVARLAANNLLP